AAPAATHGDRVEAALFVGHDRIRGDGRSGNAREGAAVEEVAPPRKRCRRRLHGRVRGGSGAPGDSGRGADERAGSANRACPYERRSLHVADSPWSWWPL